jgi:peptide/nickel transport system permease protein
MATRPAPVMPRRLGGTKVQREEGLGLWSVAWRRLRRNRRAMLGLYLLLVLAMASLFAPQLSPHDRDRPDLLVAERRRGITGWEPMSWGATSLPD